MDPIMRYQRGFLAILGLSMPGACLPSLVHRCQIKSGSSLGTRLVLTYIQVQSKV